MNLLESRWLAQLAAMRQAVAKLKLDKQNGQVEGYGHDIMVEDEDLSYENLDDIWDIFSEAEEDYSSDTSSNLEYTENEKDRLRWLRDQCVAFTNRRYGLDASQLLDQLCSLLVSDMKGSCSNPLSRQEGAHVFFCTQTMSYRCLLPRL